MVDLILAGAGCRLQICGRLTAQWFDSTWSTLMVPAGLLQFLLFCFCPWVFYLVTKPGRVRVHLKFYPDQKMFRLHAELVSRIANWDRLNQCLITLSIASNIIGHLYRSFHCKVRGLGEVITGSFYIASLSRSPLKKGTLNCQKG